MHYTSWDRADRERPVLLAEEGPETLADFGPTAAEVGEDHWRLEVTPGLGATATDLEGRVYRLAGRLGRDKRLEASLVGRTFSFINENAGDWIIDDADGTKVGQFSARNSGVRRAILEFEGDHADHDLSATEVAALSWFARIILEEKTSGMAIPIIATLTLASLVAIVTFLT